MPLPQPTSRKVLPRRSPTRSESFSTAWVIRGSSTGPRKLSQFFPNWKRTSVMDARVYQSFQPGSCRAFLFLRRGEHALSTVRRVLGWDFAGSARHLPQDQHHCLPTQTDVGRLRAKEGPGCSREWQGRRSRRLARIPKLPNYQITQLPNLGKEFSCPTLKKHSISP